MGRSATIINGFKIERVCICAGLRRKGGLLCHAGGLCGRQFWWLLPGARRQARPHHRGHSVRAPCAIANVVGEAKLDYTIIQARLYSAIAGAAGTYLV